MLIVELSHSSEYDWTWILRVERVRDVVVSAFRSWAGNGRVCWKLL